MYSILTSVTMKTNVFYNFIHLYDILIFKVITYKEMML